MTRCGLLVLTFLLGCASPHHKHPHDHGLSALKGQLVRIIGENESLLRRSLNLQAKLDDTSAKNGALEARFAVVESALLKLDILEASVARLDKQLGRVWARNADNNTDIAAQLSAHRKKLELIDALLRRATSSETDIEDLEEELEDVKEALDKFKPQKLIELDPKLAEDDEVEPWDGKKLDPPVLEGEQD